MKLLWISLLLAAACGARGAPQASESPSKTTQTRIERIERGLRPAVQVRGEDVRYSLADRMREYKIPAVSIAVFENYQVQWAKAYGLADAETGDRATDETLFLAGSISKSVNALAAMLAVADGTLSLDAPINNSLESWKLPDNDLTRAAPVTLRRLLSHTAGTTVHGFAGYAAGAKIPTVPQILDGTAPANSPAVRVDLAPGTKFRYSGGGTTITQLALTERSKRPYPELLRDRVLGPLGMAHSTFEQALPPDQLARAAAGYDRSGKVIAGKRHAYPEMAAAGLWTTPSDLARFFAELARARAGTSSRIAQSIATQMTTGVLDAGDSMVGLGVFMYELGGAKFFGHGGADAGFQAKATASLDGGYGVIVMTNSDNGWRIFAEIERAVFAEYGWRGLDPEVVRFALTPAQRARLTGSFMWHGAPITIAERGDGLALLRPFRTPIELVALAPDTFVTRPDGVRFQLDESGATLTGSSRDGDKATAARLAEGMRLPILELEAGRFDEAVAAWRALAKADPKHPAIDEVALNELGYDLMSNDIAAAIQVLRLIEAANPDSSNASDSLAEAYMTAGDPAKAIASYEAAIAKLAADPRIPADRKPVARANAERQIAKLRAK